MDSVRGLGLALSCALVACGGDTEPPCEPGEEIVQSDGQTPSGRAQCGAGVVDQDCGGTRCLIESGVRRCTDFNC